MSNRLGGKQGTAYLGTNADQPPNMVYNNRPPTQYDWQNYSVGDMWIDSSAVDTEKIWMLVSVQGDNMSQGPLAHWVHLVADSPVSSFQAYTSVLGSQHNVTGDGTPALAIFDVLNSAQTDYDPLTGLYTAPVTGLYYFSSSVNLHQPPPGIPATIIEAYSYFEIASASANPNAGRWMFACYNPYAVYPPQPAIPLPAPTTPPTEPALPYPDVCFNGSLSVALNAGDTVSVVAVAIQTYNTVGAKTVAITAGAFARPRGYTWFTGYLVS